MIDVLKKFGYRVYWQVLNTKDHGIPQNRPRFYLVAIEGKSKRHPFRFPPSIDPEPIENFMEKDVRQQELTTDTQKTALNAAKKKLKKKGIDSSVAVHAFVDVGATPKRSSAMVGTCPCLTSSRCKMGGHYSTVAKRMLTRKEMLRLQVIPPNRFNYKTAGVKEDDLKFAVANAMSTNVLMRLLPDTLWAAGLLVEKKIVLPTRFSKYVCY